jgi:hypothetical protein
VLPMWTVQAVLVPPSPVGPLLSHGAAALVEDAAHEAGELYGHWIAQIVGTARAGIDVHEVAADEVALAAVRDRWAVLLGGLIAATPDLAGWSVDVAVRVEEDAEEDYEPADDQLDAAAEALVDAVDSVEDEDTGDSAADVLVRSAELFRAVPMELLLPADFDALGADERGDVLARATYLAGCLIEAAVIVTDQLFEDLEALGAADVAELGELSVLAELPERYTAHYTVPFARRFLVAFTDMTRRLTSGWEPLANAAQELSVRLLLNQVEMIAAFAGVDLPERWRPTLAELLFEDTDHEYLYAEDAEPDDGLELDWFVPYAEDRHLPVYATDQPAG